MKKHWMSGVGSEVDARADYLFTTPQIMLYPTGISGPIGITSGTMVRRHNTVCDVTVTNYTVVRVHFSSQDQRPIPRHLYRG